LTGKIVGSSFGGGALNARIVLCLLTRKAS